MNKTILLDVDGVLADSLTAWVNSLERATGVNLNQPVCHYDVTQYFAQELKYEGLDGFEFWKGEDPYKHVLPLEGAVEGCNMLKRMGYDLIPVSKIYAEHTNSKRKWLDKYFDMLDPAIYISLYGSKSRVKGDYIVDDYMPNMLGFTAPTKGVVFMTDYHKYQEGVDMPVEYVHNWKQLVNYLEGEQK